MDQTQKLIVTLSAVLGAVILASAVLFFLLPKADHSISTPTTGSSTFDTSVFQAPGFLQLDQRAVLDNSLPVPPPATPGKANPFL